MKTKFFSTCTLALILVLAMAVSLFTISVSAATTESLRGHGSNISSIVVTGANFESVDYTTSTDIHGTVYDYYLAVPTNTADGTALTAKFTAADGQPDGFVISSRGDNVPNPPLGLAFIRQGTSDTYTATLTDGAALATAFVHKDINAEFGKCDTYHFHYYMSVPVSISTGDPVFIAWNGTNGTVTGRDGSSRIPSSFTLWVDGSSTITVDNSTVSSDYANEGNYAFTITPKTSGNTTIVATSNGTTYTVTCGPKSATPSGVAPSSVISYLPLGQFATGSGWGSVANKFTSGYASTGVSLGAFGGYVEFKFDEGITNDENNPYGVDFVVYGNAFNGNPEAGAVQVSEDGKTWYELAGSRYYDGNFSFTGTTVANKFSKAYTGTLNNAAVRYEGSSSSDAKITATVTSGSTSMTANPFISSYGWWPTVAEGYPMAGSHNNSGSNVQVSHSDSVLTFSGLTLIPDSDVTADYAFGYADVTPNGSPATYGDAVNPYTPYTSSKTGGDGFDLEWAVNSDGMPVDVTGKTFYYVRVYSAVLDNGTFGETSTEVCGIFTTANKASGSVNRSSITSLTINDGGYVVGDIGDFADAEMRGGVVFYDLSDYGITSATIEAAAANSTIYMNSTATNAYITTANTEYVRVIVQTGEKAPYIAVIKL